MRIGHTASLTMSVRGRGMTRILRGATGVAVLLGLFEVLTRAELVNPTYLPPASTVLGTTASILLDVEFLRNVQGTLTAWAIGLTVATVIAVPIGLLLGSSWKSYLAATTAIEFLRPIPSVALIPLAILLIGRGLEMRVALIAYASIWPILFNTIYGIRDVDPLAKETARAFGFSKAAILRQVSLRWALPFIYTGIRISAAIALILAISTELIAGGGPGIGTWMLRHSETGVPRDLLYAGIVVAGLLGMLINAVMGAGEQRFFSWHQRLRGAG
jgi:NitT/TauT family transport system permease protein